MMTGQIVAVISSFESSHKAERVVAAQMAKASKGELLAKLWGYEGNIPIEEARRAIPALFDTFLRTENIEAARAAFIAEAPDAPSSRPLCLVANGVRRRRGRLLGYPGGS